MQGRNPTVTWRSSIPKIYYIKIEKNSTFCMSPKQTEQLNKKLLNVNVAMNG